MNARNQQTEYVIKNKGGEQTSCPWIVKPLILRGEMRSQRKWLAKPPNNTFFYGRKDEICRKIKWNFCMKITLKFVFHHLLLFQRQRKFQTPLIPLQNLDHWWNVEKYDENVVVKHIFRQVVNRITILAKAVNTLIVAYTLIFWLGGR